MGFSFDEMAYLSMDEYGDILEMQIESTESHVKEETQTPVEIDATQAHIDAFFK